MNYKESEIHLAARAVLDAAHAAQKNLVAVSGELGAGKTTLAKAIAKELGIQDVVQSPTFVLMRSYDSASREFPWKRFVHIDAYRLERGQDEILGLHTLLANPDTLVLIEWPERLSALQQLPHIACTVRHVSETVRNLAIGSR